MMCYLIYPNRGINAIVEYDEVSSYLTILKGCKACPILSMYPTFREIKPIDKQRQLYDKTNIIQQDIVFKNSSTSRHFVICSSTDGPRSWKNEKSLTFRIIMNGAKEN